MLVTWTSTLYTTELRGISVINDDPFCFSEFLAVFRSCCSVVQVNSQQYISCIYTNCTIVQDNLRTKIFGTDFWRPILAPSVVAFCPPLLSHCFEYHNFSIIWTQNDDKLYKARKTSVFQGSGMPGVIVYNISGILFYENDKLKKLNICFQYSQTMSNTKQNSMPIKEINRILETHSNKCLEKQMTKVISKVSWPLLFHFFGLLLFWKVTILGLWTDTFHAIIARTFITNFIFNTVTMNSLPISHVHYLNFISFFILVKLHRTKNNEVERQD